MMTIKKTPIGLYILGAVILVLAVYLIVQGIRCRSAVRKSYERLETYGAEAIQLSYGKMSYVDRGEGEVILSVHGICGGYDQAFDTCRELTDDYRIIAPSRFGYTGSDVWGDSTPALQATAYAELLDRLNIDKVYVLATSAGGAAAMRFALDYPERTKGLILYCSGAPLTEKPEKLSGLQGPPEALCSNFAMFAVSPLFGPLMGMEPDTIYSILPISEKVAGIQIDANVTNPDMAKNFAEYPVESLLAPTLILHAKDDKLADYEAMYAAHSRFPDCTFISFETGGHMMAGHSEEIRQALDDFIK